MTFQLAVEQIRILDRLYVQAQKSNSPKDWKAYEDRKAEFSTGIFETLTRPSSREERGEK